MFIQFIHILNWHFIWALDLLLGTIAFLVFNYIVLYYIREINDNNEENHWWAFFLLRMLFVCFSAVYKNALQIIIIVFCSLLVLLLDVKIPYENKTAFVPCIILNFIIWPFPFRATQALLLLISFRCVCVHFI